MSHNIQMTHFNVGGHVVISFNGIDDCNIHMFYLKKNSLTGMLNNNKFTIAARKSTDIVL